MSPGTMPVVVPLIIILVIVALLVILVIGAFNGLVRLRNRVDNAWAQIDVQLKRRYDLIPNLVETVKGLRRPRAPNARSRDPGAQHGDERARAGAQQAQAENMISGALKSLFALSEAYPDLKANQNFLNLQEELTGTEGRIAYARQFYNDTVQRYNTKIQTFPAVVIAGMFHFTAREYFEVEESARDAVHVSFDTAPAVSTQPAAPSEPAPPAPPAPPPAQP